MTNNYPEELKKSEPEPHISDLVHENCKLNEQYLREYNMYLDKLAKDQKNIIDRLIQVLVAQELSMRRAREAEKNLKEDESLSQQKKTAGGSDKKNLNEFQ